MLPKQVARKHYTAVPLARQITWQYELSECCQVLSQVRACYRKAGHACGMNKKSII